MSSSPSPSSRRRFLTQFCAISAAGLALPLLQACGQTSATAPPATAAPPAPTAAAAKPTTAPAAPTAAPAAPTIAPTAAAKPTTAAAQPTAAPAAVTAQPAADSGWEDMWKKAATPYQGMTLRLPVGQQGHWGVNEEASKEFERISGIKSVWENNPYEQLYDKVFLDLTSQSGTYDIIPLNYAWFGGFMSGNHLEPVESYLKDDRFPKVDMSVFIPKLVEVYTVWEGKQYGLPWLGDAMVFPYNTEHFKDAGLDPNVPPKDWAQVIDYGKKLTKGDRYGFSLMGGRQIQAMCTYAAILFSFNKDFYDASGRPQFATDEGIKAMGVMADLVPVSPPSSKTWEIDQAAEAVAQGVASMEIQWPGILGGLTDPQKSKVLGKMAYGPPPVRGPLGGWGIAMSAHSKNKEPAWLMMNYLTTPRIQKQYAPKGYAITAAGLFQDPDIQKVYPYAKPFGDALAIGSPWPRTPESNDVFTIMAKHVNAVIVGDEKPDEGARAMNQEVEDLRRERGFITS